MKPDFSNLISKESALELVFSRWDPTPVTELVPLWEAAGRILAEDQFAQHNLPVVRASTMDGVAVKSERFENGMPDTSRWQLGVDYVRADTGDDFDDAFDAVIAIEDVELSPDGSIRFPQPVKVTPGYQVKKCGADLAKGSLLVSKGATLTPQALAALGMGGVSQVPVIRKPRVAFVPTGSELIPLGTAPQRGENVDSNSILVYHMLKDMGAEPVLHPIVPDEPEALRAALAQVLDCDILLINAGTSKGGEDFSFRLLEEEGELLFHGVAAVPGRPMSVAILDGKPMVNLSGPSFAAFYSMDWMVRALVSRALGVAVPQREKVKAVLTAPLQTPPFFAQMVPMRVAAQQDGSYAATPLALKGSKSAGLAAALMADGVYLSTPGEQPHEAGSQIEVELLKNRSELSHG
jgi:molybdopterin molybdotransferase/putative molybdopterin biosynthesis protein